MKRFAHNKTNTGYEKMNVWQVKELKINNSEEFNKLDLYSTHSKNKRQMTFVNRKPNMYFRYNEALTSCKEGSEETLTHEVIKEIIAELSILNICVNNEKIIIFVEESDIESHYTDGKNILVFDVFIKFKKSIPNHYYMKWNGELAFEVKVTHEVDLKKQQVVKRNNIALIEHTVSSKFYVDEDRIINNADFEKAKTFLFKQYSEIIYGKLLSNPSSEEYLEMKKIEELEMIINELKISKRELENQNRKLQTEIVDLDKKAIAISIENMELEKKIQSLDIQKEDVEKRMSKFKSNIAIKFLEKIGIIENFS